MSVYTELGEVLLLEGQRNQVRGAPTFDANCSLRVISSLQDGATVFHTCCTVANRE